jgi:hypothetical protein
MIVLAMATTKKNKAAQALVAERWKKTTGPERTEVAQELNASRWANATPEERAAHGQMLADARAKAAKKRAAAKKAKQ